MRGRGQLASPRTPAGGASRGACTRLPGARRGYAHRGVSPSLRSRSPQPGKVSGRPPVRTPLGLPPRASRRSRWRPQNFPAERAGPGGPEGQKPEPDPGTPRRPPARPRLGAGHVLPRLPALGAADRSRSQRRGRARARASRQAGSQRAPPARAPPACRTPEVPSWQRRAPDTDVPPRRQVILGGKRVMELMTSKECYCQRSRPPAAPHCIPLKRR